MDLEKLKNENEYLKKENESNREVMQIRMNRIFQLVDELEEANARCSKLQDMIDEATEVVDGALRLDEMDETYSKLNEIKDILEG